MHAGPSDEFWFWLSLGSLGLGLLACIPMWFRGRALRAGRATLGDEDVFMRNVMGTLMMAGIGGLIWSAGKYLSQTLPVLVFLGVVTVWLAILALIGARIDSNRRQR